MLFKLPEELHAVDAHNHVWFKKDKTLNESALNDMLDAADTLGIEKICVSLPLLAPRHTAEECRRANDAVIQAVLMHPDRLIGFCFVDAACGDDAVAEVDRCVLKHGVRGIKMYHQHKIQDRVQAPVLKRAAELGIPVLMHAGYFNCSRETREREPLCSHAADFLEALELYPETMFIQAHIGGGGDWQWNLRQLEGISSDNYWIDLSGSVHDAGILRATIDAVGSERVLFATDGSFEESVGKFLAARLSPAEMKRSASGNFENMMKRRKTEVLHD